MTFPHRPLAILPTPLHRLPALETRLGSGPLYIKRDDLTGFGLAGNKARALEYLLGDALARRTDVVVTAGAPGSNFVAAAALGAQVCGLDCDILVSGPPQDPNLVGQRRSTDAANRANRTPLPHQVVYPTVVLQLASHAGANLCYTGADREDLDELVDKHAGQLRGEGRNPYAIPRGGATPVGALGFVRAAEELAAQLAATGHDGDAVLVLPTGSGASLAGLLAGRAAIGAQWRTYGVSVSRPLPQIRTEVLRLAGQCAELTGSPVATDQDLHLMDSVGQGFGRVSETDLRSVMLALRSEGVLLDPTYGAKAFAAVLALLEAGERAPIVLWHTGGLPCALSLLATAAVQT